MNTVDSIVKIAQQFINKPVEPPESYPSLLVQDAILLATALGGAIIWIPLTTAITGLAISVVAENLTPLFFMGLFATVFAYAASGLRSLRQEQDVTLQAEGSSSPFALIAIVLLTGAFNSTLVGISMAGYLLSGFLVGEVVYVIGFIAPALDLALLKKTGYSISGVVIQLFAGALIALGILSDFSVEQMPLIPKPGV